MMEKRHYEVTTTLVVRCVVEAYNQSRAADVAAGRLSATESWQAWGEDYGPDNDGLRRWVDEVPIVTSTHVFEV